MCLCVFMRLRVLKTVISTKTMSSPSLIKAVMHESHAALAADSSYLRCMYELLSTWWLWGKIWSREERLFMWFLSRCMDVDLSLPAWSVPNPNQSHWSNQTIPIAPSSKNASHFCDVNLWQFWKARPNDVLPVWASDQKRLIWLSHLEDLDWHCFYHHHWKE